MEQADPTPCPPVGPSAIKGKIKAKEQQEMAISEAELKTKREIATLRENLLNEKVHHLLL